MQVLGSDLAPARARGRFIGLWRMLAELGNASSPTLFQVFYTIGAAASFSFIAFSALMVSLVIGFKVQETVRSEGGGGRRRRAREPEFQPVEPAGPPGIEAARSAVTEKKASP